MRECVRESARKSERGRGRARGREGGRERKGGRERDEGREREGGTSVCARARGRRRSHLGLFLRGFVLLFCHRGRLLLLYIHTHP